jgi:uncharacterized protein YprB with RNaseH-like and TPR domain
VPKGDQVIQQPNEIPRVLFLDLECTNLKADFGFILVAGMKWLHEKKAFTYTLATHPGKKVTDDSALVKAVADTVDTADVLVTYYGRRFDIPFLTSRLLLADPKRVLLLSPTQHIDLWFTVKYKLKLRNNRLASLIEFLNLNNKKTPILGQYWVDAQAGDRNALKYVEKHCIPDVLALEEGYLILRPLIDKHPRMKLQTQHEVYPCPNCGSESSRSKGLAATTAGLRKQRRKCSECGHPFFGRVERLKPCSTM